MNRIIYNLILCFLFMSGSTTVAQDSLQSNELDTLKWINEDVHSFHMTILSLLDMDTVRAGYDSIRIRVFVNPALGKPNRVIQLSLKNGKWNGLLINYKLVYNNKEKSFYAKKIKKKRVNPESNWNVFMEDIISHGLLTLPDDELIQNYPVVVDGISFCVQISMNNSYRFYSYSNPGITKEKIKEAKSMDYIINKIYNELRIK